MDGVRGVVPAVRDVLLQEKRGMERNSKIALFLASLLAVIIVTAIYAAAEAMYAEDRVWQEVSEISLPTPLNAPPLTQDSIDLALVLFNIKVPPGAKIPSFDANLADRGITVQRGVGHPYEITIGPAAFTSWGMLGSTLAHEIEVHCNQNFVFIRLLDLIGLEGTNLAEREAYTFEYQHAVRFKLSASELSSIQDTMEFYYPLKVTKKASLTKVFHEFCQFLVSSDPPKLVYSALSPFR